ncbi:MAG: P-II family nitrogen regulator, partial [Fimbriimonadales bacterium]|nr:P-II family nitrogen regulator [Fimbriimonadales bacterium]
ETLIRLPIRLRLEMVVPDALVEPVVEAILQHARTGQPDDGKIFILPYADAVRIRTEERGESAL